MSPYSFIEILRQLQSSRFCDLSGTRVSATVPVSERLVNEIVARSLPPNVPLREVQVQPLPGDAFSVRIVPRAAFIPSMTLRLEVVRQPDLPSSPVLVLRLATMGGLFAFAGAAFNVSSLLPPGVKLDADRVLVDLNQIAAQQHAADLLEHVTRLRVNTVEGRVVLHADIEVR